MNKDFPEITKVKCCNNCKHAIHDYDWTILCDMNETYVDCDDICPEYEEDI